MTSILGKQVQFLIDEILDGNVTGFGRICGVSTTKLNTYTSGKSDPATKVIIQIVEGCKKAGHTWVTADWLLFGESKQPADKAAETQVKNKAEPRDPSHIFSDEQMATTGGKAVILSEKEFVAHESLKKAKPEVREAMMQAVRATLPPKGQQEIDELEKKIVGRAEKYYADLQQAAMDSEKMAG